MTFWHLQYFGMWALGTVIGISVGFFLFLTVCSFTRPYFESKRRNRVGSDHFSGG